MSRIQKFYERRFRALAAKLGNDHGDRAAAELFDLARALSGTEHISRSLALALTLAELRRAAHETTHYPQRFLCDAGLGGLARWLRGSGYETHWDPALDDPAVIREAQRLGATLITTDSLMMERGILRDGIVASVWLPSSLTCEQQLVVVLRELDLPMRDSRCMSCGGELRRVEKAAVADRIPPKTYRWLDEYFVCAQCGQLFWRGTHWQRITRELARLQSAVSRTAANTVAELKLERERER